MSLDDIGTGLIRRHVGRRFIALRQQAGFSQQQVADKIQRARTTIMRIEEGNESARFRDLDVIALLDLYGADEKERELLLALTAETWNGRAKSWWHDFTDTEIPDWFELYVMFEDSAESIRQYESFLIPGLLQTPEYAEFIVRSLNAYVEDGDVERLVKARMKRQTILSRAQPPQLTTIINESAIRCPIGEHAIMFAQLRHVLTLADYRNVAVRVLPTAAGIHGAMTSNGFSLLRFPSDPHGNPVEPPLAYDEALTGARYMHKPAENAEYDRVWSDIEGKALDVSASKELILSVMEGHHNE